MGDSLVNTCGNELARWLDKSPLMQIIPTRFPSRTVSNSFLDNFLVSAFVTVKFHEHFHNKLRTLDYDSDHDAVEIIISTNDTIKAPPVIIPCWERTNVKLMNQMLSSELALHCLPTDRNVSVNEIEECVKNMETVFERTIEKCVPKVKLKKKCNLSVPQNILDFIHERKRSGDKFLGVWSLTANPP